MTEGVEIAAASVDSGRAATALADLVAASNAAASRTDPD